MYSANSQASETAFDGKLGDTVSPWASKEADKILGATNELGNITFLVKFKDGDIDIVPASYANTRWPQEVIAFYEPKVKWISHSAHR